MNDLRSLGSTSYRAAVQVFMAHEISQSVSQSVCQD